MFLFFSKLNENLVYLKKLFFEKDKELYLNYFRKLAMKQENLEFLVYTK